MDPLIRTNSFEYCLRKSVYPAISWTCSTSYYLKVVKPLDCWERSVFAFPFHTPNIVSNARNAMIWDPPFWLVMSSSKATEQAAQTVYRNKEGKRVTRAELLAERARERKVKVGIYS